jgi:hypothetical protein
MFTMGVDLRALTHRELSRHLVSLWTVENADAEDLMRRILPAGLLSYLDAYVVALCGWCCGLAFCGWLCGCVCGSIVWMVLWMRMW